METVGVYTSAVFFFIRWEKRPNVVFHYVEDKKYGERFLSPYFPYLSYLFLEACVGYLQLQFGTTFFRISSL